MPGISPAAAGGQTRIPSSRAWIKELLEEQIERLAPHAVIVGWPPSISKEKQMRIEIDGQAWDKGFREAQPGSDATQTVGS
jgi:hypothetical protein